MLGKKNINFYNLFLWEFKILKSFFKFYFFGLNSKFAMFRGLVSNFVSKNSFLRPQTPKTNFRTFIGVSGGGDGKPLKNYISELNSNYKNWSNYSERRLWDSEYDNRNDVGMFHTKM